MLGNKFQKRIIELGRIAKSRLVIPEVEDQRIICAVQKLKELGFDILDINDFAERMDQYFLVLKQQKFTRNWPDELIYKYLEDPVHRGAVMVMTGDADGLIAGAVTSTAEVIRTAIRTVGIKGTSKWVSSIFFMVSPDGNHAYTYADCGVIPEPTSEQLAFIANDSAHFHEFISGETPKVAFLSFSTMGSADHYRVKRVKEAVSIFGKKFSKVIHEGELQFDVAVSRDVAHRKINKPVLNGKANVMIFPNLDAGNIAYKITERFGNFTAWGPLLQGLNKPVHDLSRGCSVDDIVHVAAITAMQKEINANI